MNFNEWDGVFYDAVVANAIMAYIGTEVYLVNAQLREEKQYIPEVTGNRSPIPQRTEWKKTSQSEPGMRS